MARARRRTVDVPDDVVAEVERRLALRLDRSTMATGAWAESSGYRTDRGTWVRVDSRSATVIQPQAWVGAEAASVIRDVPKPAWFQSATWLDASSGRVWRAEEMELVAEPVIAGRGAVLTADPGLPDTWWTQLRTALAALAGFRTFRVSGRQELITRRISQVLGGAVQSVDTTVTEWTTSHGDLHWGNLTAPRPVLLDWADWGLAPRGNDAAGLWATALAFPAVADRVLTEFHDDLESRSGRIARLWVVSNILRIADRRADARALTEPAAKAADQLVADLR
ncbi:hypothetical protein BJF78_27785 [Pseudonocardia sp. CNS-139]|nr:hypothetical protein BJF78_27785 [Pseudonocardia sp. CNS-139]